MDNKGHSLLECAVAMAILGVVLMGTMGVYYQMQLLDKTNQNSVLAMKACQEVMEQLTTIQIDDLPLQNGVKFDFLAIKLTNPQIGLINVQQVLSGTNNKVYEVKVTISYNGNESAPFSAILTTRRTK